MVTTIPVCMGVGKGIQTIVLAAERNKDWTVMKVLLEGGVEPVSGDNKPCSYWWMGRGCGRHFRYASLTPARKRLIISTAGYERVVSDI